MNNEYIFNYIRFFHICIPRQVGWQSIDAQKPEVDEQNITHSGFVLCSAVHVILENQLAVTCLALYIAIVDLLAIIQR